MQYHFGQRNINCQLSIFVKINILCWVKLTPSIKDQLGHHILIIALTLFLCNNQLYFMNLAQTKLHFFFLHKNRNKSTNKTSLEEIHFIASKSESPNYESVRAFQLQSTTRKSLITFLFIVTYKLSSTSLFSLL